MERQMSSDEWVAIQPDPFATTESRTSTLRFKAAWNEPLHKIAIVCHEEEYRVIRRTLKSTRLPGRLSDSKSGKGAVESGKPKRTSLLNGTSNGGWTTMMSIQELQYAHKQMCLVMPELADFPPALPFDPRGIWSWVYTLEIPDGLDDDVVRYLNTAGEIVGKKLLIDTLFNSSVGIDSYVENYGKLRQDAYEADVEMWREQLQNSHRQHVSVKKMVRMMELYDNEDEILNGLACAQAELFNLYLQPYLDLRELAFNNLLNLQERLEDEAMSDQGREKCTMEYSEWQEHYVNSIDAINKMRIKYFEQCMETTKAIASQMRTDSKKFGKASWEAGGEERLHGFQLALSQDRIQLQQAKKDNYKHELGKIKQDLACVDEGPGFQHDVEELERKALELQLNLFDTQLGILQDQESQCSKQLKQLQVEIQEVEDNVMFFDAVENMEDLDLDVEAEEEGPIREEESRTLEEKYQRSKVLRSRVARISKRKAQLRNNKRLCLSQNEEKAVRTRMEEVEIQNHRKIKMKHEQQAFDQEKKKDFYNAERQKTIERLKNFNMKYPSPKTIKPHQVKNQRGNKPQSGSRSSASSNSRSPNPKISSRSRTSKVVTPSPGKKSPPKKSTSDVSPKSTPAPPPYPPPGGPPVSAPPPPPPPPPPPAAPTPPPPPPPPPSAQASTATPPLTSGGRLKREKTDEKQKDAGKPSAGLDLGSILNARKNLQKRSGSEVEGAQSASKDPMMNTLNLIRQGVRLRQVKAEGQAPRKATQWENSELFNAINKLRSQVETVESYDSDDEFI